MKKIIFHIDTSMSREVVVAIDIAGKVFSLRQAHDSQRSQAVLPLIESLLRERGLRLSDLTEITTAPGPGSFTGLRIGLAVANTLGILLAIPVNGLPAGKAGKKTLATPTYS